MGVSAEDVRKINVLQLCEQASKFTGRWNRVPAAEMPQALMGICQLYGLYAYEARRDSYAVTLNGLESELFPRGAVLHQIGLSVGSFSPQHQERILRALELALGEQITASPEGAYLHGCGVLLPLEGGAIELRFQEPLAKWFPAGGGDKYLTTAQ